MVAPLREHLQEFNTLRRNIAAVITQDTAITDHLKKEIKNRILLTYRLFLPTEFFNILGIGQMHVSSYAPSFFNVYS